MKQYNCPDCIFPQGACGDCYRVTKQRHNSPDEQWPSQTDYTISTYIPACCKNCSNHPSNGGSGNCNCALPYMTSSWNTI